MTTPLQISFDVAHRGWERLGATGDQWRDRTRIGWQTLLPGYRGRFGMYMTPLLEALGLAELTHDARNNRMRAL